MGRPSVDKRGITLCTLDTSFNGKSLDELARILARNHSPYDAHILNEAETTQVLACARQGLSDNKRLDSYSTRVAMVFNSDAAKSVYQFLVGGAVGAAVGGTVAGVIVYGTMVFCFNENGERVYTQALNAAGLGAVFGAVSGSYLGVNADNLRLAAKEGLRAGFYSGLVAASLLLLAQSLRGLKAQTEVMIDKTEQQSKDLIDYACEKFEKSTKVLLQEWSNERAKIKKDFDDSVQLAIRRGGEEGKILMKQAEALFDRNFNRADAAIIQKLKDADDLLQKTSSVILKSAGKEIRQTVSHAAETATNAAEIISKNAANHTMKGVERLPTSIWLGWRNFVFAPFRMWK